MSDYLGSKLVKAGLIILVLGTGPLLFIIVAAAVGLWPDPNPNPVGPGLLAGLSIWPGMVCLGIGILKVRADRKNAQP
jgi:hypothetical protein